uniref:Predicted protein n=1 Tax=Hordeum vulgare subsp. vulgare TaxID=112509 RepID=F2D0N5_HORVV|nr:predicted protein [Hordeum vulgare subsp. vulgare]
MAAVADIPWGAASRGEGRGPRVDNPRLCTEGAVSIARAGASVSSAQFCVDVIWRYDELKKYHMRTYGS